MKFDDDENFRSQQDAAARRSRDFDDLQNELAGNATGRASRFLPPEAAGGNVAEKRRTERAEAHTRLQLLLMANPAYAALYNETAKGLRETQNDLDRMRDRALLLLEEENDIIAQIDARAARDSTGQPVFKDRGGIARYADGAPVPEDEAEAIVWRGDEPGFEERQDHADKRQRIADLVTDIDAGQAEIGEMQERLDDHENPASVDELTEIGSRKDEIVAASEAQLQSMLKIEAPESPQFTSARPVTNAKVPEL